MIFDISVITSDMTAARRSHCEVFVEQLRAEHEVEWRFVTEAEPSEVTSDFVASSVKLEQLTDPRLERYNKYSKTLNVRHVSNALKHLKALQRIAEGGGRAGAVHLVIEDDILATNGWLENLNEALSKAPSDYDFLTLGVPSDSPAPRELGDPYEVLPCCDSYVVTEKAAAMLSSSFLPIRYTTNVQLSYLMRSLKMRAYIGSPIVFLDGSKYGGFISVLTAGNQLILNSAYMGARRSLVDGAASDAKEIKEIADGLAASPFAQHPDFMHLSALAEWRLNGADAAAGKFKAALEVYRANHALVNSESQFLRDYISLHKDLQAA